MQSRLSPGAIYWVWLLWFPKWHQFFSNKTFLIGFEQVKSKAWHDDIQNLARYSNSIKLLRLEVRLIKAKWLSILVLPICLDNTSFIYSKNVRHYDLSNCYWQFNHQITENNRQLQLLNQLTLLLLRICTVI